jgi:hypothetical protein
MSIRTRLQCLERLNCEHRPAEPEGSKAERWLRLLQLVEPFVQEHAADRLDGHRQAVALLTDYAASGRVNAHIEYRCGCYLNAAWAFCRKYPNGGRLPFLEPDHLGHLQEGKQI